MVRLSRRATAFSIGTLIALVIAILLLWFYAIPAIKMLWRGVESTMACEGECMTHCPDDYTRDRRGDAWCQDEYEDKHLKCCNPMQDASGQVISSSDIKIYYNRDRTHPLRDGETVEFKRVTKGNNVGYTAHFDVALSKRLRDKRYFCYGQLTSGDWSVVVPFSELFSGARFRNLFSPSVVRPYDPAVAIDKPQDTCAVSIEELKKKQQAANYDPFLDFNDFFKLIGRSVRYDVVVVDRETCSKYEQGDSGYIAGHTKYYFDTCDSSRRSVNLVVPKPEPVITLKVDSQEVTSPMVLSKSTNDRTVTHTFQWSIEDPLPSCEIIANFGPAPKQNTAFNPLSVLGTKDGEGWPASGAPGTKAVPDNTCAQEDPRIYTKTVTFPKDLPAGMTFTLGLQTYLPSRTGRLLQAEKEYQFIIEPDTRLQVYGPSPGVARSKPITISCEGSCSDVKFQLVNSPWDCTADPKGSWQDIQGVEPVDGSLLWDFAPGTQYLPLTPKEVNGHYLCVQAKVGENEYVAALGMANGQPQPFEIDRTPPTGEVRFIPEKMTVIATCKDEPSGGVASGCPRRPFSYAFVTDPLLFAGYLTGLGGALRSDFDACPDPYEGGYIPVSAEAGPNGQVVYRYDGVDVVVLCVAIKDAAGNYYVKPVTLYSQTYMIAQLINAMLG